MGEAPYDYERSLASVAPEDRKVLIAMASPYFYRDRARVAEIALQQRIASMSQARAATVAGSLLSFGPDLDALFARAATYIDRIARGAKPIDLPVEQPTKFELVINMKTAKALGIDMPLAILSRADEVIE